MTRFTLSSSWLIFVNMASNSWYWLMVIAPRRNSRAGPHNSVPVRARQTSSTVFRPSPSTHAGLAHAHPPTHGDDPNGLDQCSGCRNAKTCADVRHTNAHQRSSCQRRREERNHQTDYHQTRCANVLHRPRRHHVGRGLLKQRPRKIQEGNGTKG